MMIIIIMMIKSIIATLLHLVCPSAVLLKLAFNAPLHGAFGTETSFTIFCAGTSFEKNIALEHETLLNFFVMRLFTLFYHHSPSPSLFTMINDIFPESFALSLSLSLSFRRCFQQRTLTFPKFVNFKRLLMLTAIHFTEPLLQIPEAISNSN